MPNTPATNVVENAAFQILIAADENVVIPHFTLATDHRLQLAPRDFIWSRKLVSIQILREINKLHTCVHSFGSDVTIKRKKPSHSRISVACKSLKWHLKQKRKLNAACSGNIWQNRWSLLIFTVFYNYEHAHRMCAWSSTMCEVVELCGWLCNFRHSISLPKRHLVWRRFLQLNFTTLRTDATGHEFMRGTCNVHACMMHAARNLTDRRPCCVGSAKQSYACHGYMFGCSENMKINRTHKR